MVLLAFLLLTACSHKQETPPEPVKVSGKFEGVTLELESFFKVSKEDMKLMRAAAAKKGGGKAKLSDNREALCNKTGCEVKMKDFAAKLNMSDMDKLNALLIKADLSKKEESLSDEIVTLRCLPDQCAADLHYKSKGEILINPDGSTNFDLQNETKGILLRDFLRQGFVKGLK